MIPRPVSSRRLLLGTAADTPLAMSGALPLGAGTTHAADSAFVMGLDLNDGTSAFAADTTFRPTPGLAAAGWVSFRSRTYPTRNPRHLDCVLRISPICTTTDRQDALFRVGY